MSFWADGFGIELPEKVDMPLNNEQMTHSFAL